MLIQAYAAAGRVGRYAVKGARPWSRRAARALR